MLLGFLFKHRMLGVVVIVLVVVIVGFITIQNRSHKTVTASTPVSSYQATMPSIETAPRVVQTSSRIYLVSKMTTEEEGIVLLDYFTYNSGKWEHRTQPLELDKKIYGEFKVYDR